MIQQVPREWRPHNGESRYSYMDRVWYWTEPGTDQHDFGLETFNLCIGLPWPPAKYVVELFIKSFDGPNSPDRAEH